MLLERSQHRALRRLAPWLAAGTLCLTQAACGARTGARELDGGPECVDNMQCSDGLFCNGAERCVDRRCEAGEAVVCNDNDPCTVDRCAEPNEGGPGCVSDDPRQDQDGDGYYGTTTAIPQSCANDCDDTRADAFPGAPETCNGLDDDCDGQVDEGAAYQPLPAPVRVSNDPAQSRASSLAWSERGETWGTTYWDFGDGSANIWFEQRARDGAAMGTPKLLTPLPADAFGGKLVWGERNYGIAWQDRRHGNYEIFFNRLTSDGEKLAADLRVTNARGWSISPSIVWTGERFAIAWQDGRDFVEAPGNFEIYVTFVDRDGFELGDDLRITQDPASSERPRMVLGDDELGIAFIDDRSGQPQAYLLVTDLNGAIQMQPTRLSVGDTPAQQVDLAWNGEAFVVAWEQQNLSGDADVVLARVPRSPASAPEGPYPLQRAASWSRSPAIATRNGDSLVLFADDGDGTRFNLLLMRFDRDLQPIGPVIQVTDSSADSIFPVLATGEAQLGLLFSDQRHGNWEVFWSALQCTGLASR